MKGLVLAIVLCLFQASMCLSADNPENEFKRAYEDTEVLTDTLFEEVSSALAGMFKMINEAELLEVVDKLSENALILMKSAEKMNREASAYEAMQMNTYLKRIREMIVKTEERDHMVMLLSRYYLHYNNCVMNNLPVLKQMQFEHKEELRQAIAANEKDEIGHLAEHLHVHSDQMFYALSLFETPQLKKTGMEVRMISDEIFQNSLKGDMGAVNAGINKFEPLMNKLNTISE